LRATRPPNCAAAAAASGSPLTPGAVVDLGLTQEQLAARLGTVRELVSRALAQLERAGAIKRSRSGIVIRDPGRLAEAARAGVLELECELYPDPAYASDTVTAIRYPPGVDDAKFRTILREEHRVILAGGQSQLKGKIFRIGHMGICSFGDLAAGFLGIEGALAALGHRFDRGDSVEAIAKRA